MKSNSKWHERKNDGMKLFFSESDGKVIWLGEVYEDFMEFLRKSADM